MARLSPSASSLLILSPGHHLQAQGHSCRFSSWCPGRLQEQPLLLCGADAHGLGWEEMEFQFMTLDSAGRFASEPGPYRTGEGYGSPYWESEEVSRDAARRSPRDRHLKAQHLREALLRRPHSGKLTGTPQEPASEPLRRTLSSELKSESNSLWATPQMASPAPQEAGPASTPLPAQSAPCPPAERGKFPGQVLSKHSQQTVLPLPRPALSLPTDQDTTCASGLRRSAPGSSASGSSRHARRSCSELQGQASCQPLGMGTADLHSCAGPLRRPVPVMDVTPLQSVFCPIALESPRDCKGGTCEVPVAVCSSSSDAASSGLIVGQVYSSPWPPERIPEKPPAGKSPMGYSLRDESNYVEVVLVNTRRSESLVATTSKRSVRGYKLPLLFQGFMKGSSHIS